MTTPVPLKAVEHLPTAIAIAQAEAAPCGVKGAALALLDLWAIFPMPATEAADDIWTKTLAQYPADLVKAAIAQLIATRTWERDPPLPGQVVAILKAEHAERVKCLGRLETMQRRASLDAKTETARAGSHSAWEAKLSPDERKTLDEARKARAAGESVADLIGGVTVRKIEKENAA